AVSWRTSHFREPPTARRRWARTGPSIQARCWRRPNHWSSPSRTRNGSEIRGASAARGALARFAADGGRWLQGRQQEWTGAVPCEPVRPELGADARRLLVLHVF